MRSSISDGAPMWLEIEVDSAGDAVRISGRGSRGERLPPHSLPAERGLDALQSFANKVGRAVRSGRALDAQVVSDAQLLHADVFQGELRDMMVRLGEASRDSRLLVRLFTRDRALHGVPWEALCKPGTSEGFLGTDPRVMFARGVTSAEPWEPRDVRGAVRVLAIAPGSDERALLVLREALAPAVESGEVEWLDSIAGPDVDVRALFDRLRRGKSPHVIHWLGHGGVDLAGKPVLRLADDEDGEEAWLTAEALGRELGASFVEDLRLVILEACEGAKAGALGSAAEVLAKAGADAVVAHLWPVKADVARTCSTEIYRSLAGANQSAGDIGASVAAARRTLLAESAEGFSPILFLRASESTLFGFESRRVSTPGARRKGRGLAPALQSMLEKPFSLVLGDVDEDKDVLSRELAHFMQEQGEPVAPGLPFAALTQRCLLKYGQEVLHSLFQAAVTGSLHAPAPPLVGALARLITPGVHITLLWRPSLERAIASMHPDRTIFAIQPARGSSAGKPRVVKRAAGTTAWKMEPSLPKRFDLDDEIVVLRLYGGYSTEARPIFSSPALTEDDHIQGLLGAESLQPPVWMEELLARPRVRPGLLAALSVLDFRHRMLLQWLYDRRPAPRDSVAILTPSAEPGEAEMWEGGAGLPGNGRIAAITEEPAQLAALLDAFEGGAT